MSTPYRRKFLVLTEVARTAGCDFETVVEAIAEGTLRGFVIGTEWPLASDGERLLSDYLELPREALIRARVKQEVMVEGGKLLSGEAVRLKSTQKVPVGLVYVLGEEADRFRVARWGAQQAGEPAPTLPAREAGPRATLNLERTVGALALFVATTAGSKFKHGGAPNAKQLADAVFTLLETQGLPMSGLSTRSLEQRISEGLKALREPET